MTLSVLNQVLGTSWKMKTAKSSLHLSASGKRLANGCAGTTLSHKTLIRHPAFPRFPVPMLDSPSKFPFMSPKKASWCVFFPKQSGHNSSYLDLLLLDLDLLQLYSGFFPPHRGPEPWPTLRLSPAEWPLLKQLPSDISDDCPRAAVLAHISCDWQCQPRMFPEPLFTSLSHSWF